jgi:hypothetical protein
MRNMILDGVMVLVACICLTVMHSGIGFGDQWAEETFTFWGLRILGSQDLEDNVAKRGPKSEEKGDALMQESLKAPNLIGPVDH